MVDCFYDKFISKVYADEVSKRTLRDEPSREKTAAAMSKWSVLFRAYNSTLLKLLAQK